MAAPTIKKETIQITLEKGNGTILISRPDSTAKSIGVIYQFTYIGDATMDLMQALAAARRQLTTQMAANAAKPATPTAKPAATSAEQADANDEATEGDEPDESEQADEPGADETVEPSEEDEATPEPGIEWKFGEGEGFDELADNDRNSRDRIVTDDPASAPPELEPITIDDQVGDGDDIQALLLF